MAVARAEGDEEDYARTLDPLDCRTREETETVLSLARSWSRPVAIMRALDVAGRDLTYRHGALREGCSVYEELLVASERFGSMPGRAEDLELLVATDSPEEAARVVASCYRDHCADETIERSVARRG